MPNCILQSIGQCLQIIQECIPLEPIIPTGVSDLNINQKWLWPKRQYANTSNCYRWNYHRYTPSSSSNHRIAPWILALQPFYPVRNRFSNPWCRRPVRWSLVIRTVHHQCRAVYDRRCSRFMRDSRKITCTRLRPAQRELRSLWRKGLFSRTAWWVRE